MITHLEQRGYLAFHGGPFYTLQPAAWERPEEAATEQGIPEKPFVAMSFHESLKDVYEHGTYLAIKEDCKMDPVRIDLVRITTTSLTSYRRDSFLPVYGGGFHRPKSRGLLRSWICKGD
jgi:hypothetical protein